MFKKDHCFNTNQKIVIKIGSSLIVDNKNIRLKWLENLAQNIHEIRVKNNCQIIIVTSGAVAFGRLALNYKNQKLSIPEKQAAAGQRAGG